jgi:hypothetical protein
MTADELLKKYEDDYEYHFSTVDRQWIIEAMEEYATLRQESSSFHEGYEKGWIDATSNAINEIQKIYKS